MYNYNLNNNAWLMRNDNQSLFTPEEGYNKGNLFKNLYMPYKNYKPVNLKGKSEQENMLLELLRICFAKHELNLYLDVHPDDVSMLKLFNDYRVNENRIRNMYESKYGALDLDSNSLINSPFEWSTTSFPWEGLNV